MEISAMAEYLVVYSKEKWKRAPFGEPCLRPMQALVIETPGHRFPN